MLISLPTNSSFLSLIAAPNSAISPVRPPGADPPIGDLPSSLLAVSDPSTRELFSVPLIVSGSPLGGDVCGPDGRLLLIGICGGG
jgi:hypothetical protein